MMLGKRCVIDNLYRWVNFISVSL